MTLRSLAACALALGALAGCAGKPKQIEMRDGAGAVKPVEFPKGTFLGDVSQEQVGTLAQMVAETNVAASQRLDTLDRTAAQAVEATRRIETDLDKMEAADRAGEKRAEAAAQQLAEGQKKLEDGGRKIEEAVRNVDQDVGKVDAGVKRVEETSQKALEVGQKAWDTTKMIIEAFEKLARRQGTGELTVFYPTGSSRIEKGSLQHQRIVQFVDWLARASKGRKIMFVSVGSASATGPKELNTKLAKERSEAPLKVLDQYLVNVPHEYVKIYGTGDVYSPKGLKGPEHERYQHARLIAFYEKGQEPALPEAPAQ